MAAVAHMIGMILHQYELLILSSITYENAAKGYGTSFRRSNPTIIVLI